MSWLIVSIETFLKSVMKLVMNGSLGRISLSKPNPERIIEIFKYSCIFSSTRDTFGEVLQSTDAFNCYQYLLTTPLAITNLKCR